MELRFLNQQVPDAISVRDEIELVNCDRDSGYTNGTYTVAQLEENGDVTIVGHDNSPTASMIAVINVLDEE